jgi:hypothetical protein
LGPLVTVTKGLDGGERRFDKAAITVRRKAGTVRQSPINGGLPGPPPGVFVEGGVKTIACGTPGVSGVTVVTTLAALRRAILPTRGRDKKNRIAVVT